MLESVLIYYSMIYHCNDYEDTYFRLIDNFYNLCRIGFILVGILVKTSAHEDERKKN